MHFAWMEPTARPPQPERARASWEHELASRAALLAKLGFAKSHVEARLQRLLAWEFDLSGKSAVQKRLGAIVGEAYRRAGTAESEGNAANRPARRKSQ